MDQEPVIHNKEPNQRQPQFLVKGLKLQSISSFCFSSLRDFPFSSFLIFSTMFCHGTWSKVIYITLKVETVCQRSIHRNLYQCKSVELKCIQFCGLSNFHLSVHTQQVENSVFLQGSSPLTEPGGDCLSSLARNSRSAQ